MSWIGELQALLRQGGLRATFDAGRDLTLPCYFCGEAELPRALAVVGCYLGEHRDAVVRPLCAACAPPDEVR